MNREMVDKTKIRNLRWYERFSYSIVSSTETFYYVLGKLIARRPYTVIAICWVFVILSGLGFFRFYQEKNPLNLWVPPKSQFVLDSKRLMDTYDRAFRIEEVIMEAEDVLTPEVLMEVYELDKKVRDSVTKSGIGWRDVCFRIPEVDQSLATLINNPKSYKKKNATDLQEPFDPSVHFNARTYCTLVETMEKECYEKSLLDLWSYNPRKLRKLTKQDILDKVNKYKIDPLLGNLKNYEDLLGGIIKNETGHIVAAKALKNLWMTHLDFTAVDMDKIGNMAGTSDFGSIECLEWEDEFVRIMENASKHSKNIQIFYQASKSFGDISSATMFQGMDRLFFGGFLMVLYVQFVISKFNWVETRLLLGVLGLVSVGMSFIVAVGLCSLIGIFYGPVHASLPFLLMGLGVDDMFVIVASWDRLSAEEKRLPIEERIGTMLKHAGVSITVTTATDVLAFVVGSSTVLPCLQSYCLYAAVGVLMTFVFVVTFFIACFVLDQKRLEKNYGGIIPWRKYEDYKPNKFSQAETSNKIFNLIYSKIILTWPGKFFVIFITLVFLGFSIRGIFHLEQRFDPRWFIPKHTSLGQFLKEKSVYYPTSGYEGYTYIGAVNYTHEFVNIYNFAEKLENSSDIIEDISSWVQPFTNFVRTYFKRDLYSEAISDNEFNLYLSKFLFSPKGARFQANFKFEKDLECGIPAPKISMSNIAYRLKIFKGPEEHVPAMRRLQQISKQMNLTTGDRFSTAWSKIFATWITDEIIEEEVIRNIELALMAVMICTALLIANLQICFWVFICVVLSMTNVCGFMQYWGQTIDIVTCIGLQLAIGLCVDYATHIGHTFLTIGEGSRTERTIQTVTSIGSAVLYGGLSTLIGVIMLAFSDSYNFQAFFKIFLLVVVFGLFHGVVLLPVILSWVGPKPYYSHFPVRQTEAELT